MRNVKFASFDIKLNVKIFEDRDALIRWSILSTFG